jgi:hypothetical protein
VTARRATNQIVLVAEHQALAVIVVVILPATAGETLAVIVVAEQVVRVAIMLRIGPVVMGRPPIDLVVTGRPPIDLVATAQRGRLVLQATAHILLDPLATAIRVHVATATTAPAFPAVTAIPARHEPVAVTAPTVLARVATERALTVLAPTVRIGHVPIGHVQIALTATSREESGSQMGESVARFARR